MTELRLVSDDTYEQKVAALRREAEAAITPTADAQVVYFASWLLFYIEQYANLAQTWQDSIDKMRPR